MITVDALHQFDMKEDFHDDNDIINEATGEDWRSYLFFVHHISNPFVRFEEVLRLLAISTTRQISGSGSSSLDMLGWILLDTLLFVYRDVSRRYILTKSSK